MKMFLAAMVALLIGFSANDAEAAKRLGGGRSAGMQREAVKPATPPANPTAAPSAQAAPMQGAAAPAAAPKRSWMGPLAGLAAGLGLAALASHFGFGEGLANMLLIGLLVIVAVVVVRMILNRRNAGNQGMQYAGATAGNAPGSPPASDWTPAGNAAPAAFTGTNTAKIPAGFDVDGFVRQAKLNFIRLQAANDAGNLSDLREFTSPEMFAEIKLDIDARRGATQQTDVANLDAEVLEVTEEDGRYVASVHFHGSMREEIGGPAEPFAEIWHLTKPSDGSSGWVIAGIQQTS